MNHPYRSSAPAAVAPSSVTTPASSSSFSRSVPYSSSALSSSSSPARSSSSSTAAMTAASAAAAAAAAAASSYAAASSAAREQQLREDEDHTKCTSHQHARLVAETLAKLKQQKQILQADNWMYESNNSDRRNSPRSSGRPTTVADSDGMFDTFVHSNAGDAWDS